MERESALDHWLAPTRSRKVTSRRGFHCHHPPRGPSAIPALAAQLKR